MGVRGPGVDRQSSCQIAAGRHQIVLQSHDSARDQDDQVIRSAGKAAGEKPLGVVATALAGECLAERRQNHNVITAEREGFFEVSPARSDLVELQLDKRAVDQSLGKVGLDLERTVIGVASADQATGLGEGQTAIEVGPGKRRTADRTDGEITGCFQKSALGVVAVPQEKPGPQRGPIELLGLSEGFFGAGKITAGQEGAALQGEVVASCRDDAGRELAVRRGQLGVAQTGAVKCALGVKGAGDCGTIFIARSRLASACL